MGIYSDYPQSQRSAKTNHEIIGGSVLETDMACHLGAEKAASG